LRIAWRAVDANFWGQLRQQSANPVNQFPFNIFNGKNISAEVYQLVLAGNKTMEEFPIKY